MPRVSSFSLIATALMAASLPCLAMKLGPVVGTHCVSSYPIQWIWDEDMLTQRVALVGAQAEQEFGNVVAGFRAGLFGSYAQSVWADEEPMNEYRTDLLGGNARASAALRHSRLPEQLSAQAGVALSFDYYWVWSWGERRITSTVFTQSLGAGMRWNPSNRLSLGMDVDLNLARVGFTHYFFEDTGPSPFWVYRVGTMSPTVVLSALFPLGTR